MESDGEDNELRPEIMTQLDDSQIEEVVEKILEFKEVQKNAATELDK